jgi:hypothetical protein
MLSEVGVVLLKVVSWPSRLMPRWVAAESHSCRTCMVSGFTEAHNATGSDVAKT